jgi:ATP-dependent RNA helicase RhlE
MSPQATERIPVRAAGSPKHPESRTQFLMEFQNLGLAEPIVRAVASEGYARPTPIQANAIPHVLAGSDLLGCAQTGTGKTAAFALPILHRLALGAEQAETSAPESRGRKRKPRALILTPTRELASQIGESFRVYGRGLHLRHAVIFGGVNQNPQVRTLKAGLDIIIATPGRLIDLVNQRHVDLCTIEILVLDESDRMLDMGFIPDIRKIVAMIPRKRQTLLFSATMPADIRALAASILHEPVSVQVDPVASTVKTVTQSVYFVPVNNKLGLLRSILRGEASSRTLVFTRTKHGADKVVKDLTKNGIRAEAIHGNKNQNARTRALDAFKSKSPPVLVATDIASRGIDVDDIAHVINFDMPIDAETYVHRIGRTARAGASGAAVSFCLHTEHSKLRAIERLTGKAIAVRTDLPEHAFDAAPPHETYAPRDNTKPAQHSHRNSPAAGRKSNGQANGRTKTRSASSPRPAPKSFRASNNSSNNDGGGPRHSSGPGRSGDPRHSSGSKYSNGTTTAGRPRRGIHQRGRTAGPPAGRSGNRNAAGRSR